METTKLTIYYYKINSLKYTPFDEVFDSASTNYLENNGLIETKEISQADLYITNSEKHLKRFVSRHPFKRNILLWSNEPRFSTVATAKFRPYPFLTKVHVMNVYTGNVSIGISFYQEKRFLNREPLEYISNVSFEQTRKIAALMSYYDAGKNSSLIINGIDIDLVKMRSEIALYGYRHGIIDIYGKGWPANFAKEDSRLGNWVARKQELLGSYTFNLCFENTVYKNYITEKIWDSIENYCLPIYYGGHNSSIYDIFPENSFIDYAKFTSPKELFDYISTMSSGNYVNRLNLCIKSYNSYVGKDASFWNNKRSEVLNNILIKAKEIIN